MGRRRGNIFQRDFVIYVIPSSTKYSNFKIGLTESLNIYSTRNYDVLQKTVFHFETNLEIQS